MKRIQVSAKNPRWTLFGSHVRELRTALKKTQKEIALNAGITDVQLSRIETGESGTRLETIPRLAAALEADQNELLEMAGFLGEREQSGNIAPDLDLRRLFAGLTPDQRLIVFNAAKAVRDTLVSHAA